MKREVSADIETATRAIVDDVAARGDAALIEATRKFDAAGAECRGLAHHRLSRRRRESLRRRDARCAEIRERPDRGFPSRQLPKDDRFTDALGVELGWRWSSIESVGLYVPEVRRPIRLRC